MELLPLHFLWYIIGLRYVDSASPIKLYWVTLLLRVHSSRPLSVPESHMLGVCTEHCYHFCKATGVTFHANRAVELDYTIRTVSLWLSVSCRRTEHVSWSDISRAWLVTGSTGKQRFRSVSVSSFPWDVSSQSALCPYVMMMCKMCSKKLTLHVTSAVVIAFDARIFSCLQEHITYCGIAEDNLTAEKHTQVDSITWIWYGKYI
jgi:hypothetical protein